MKTKKSLACLLACLMTVGAMAFAACGEETSNSGTSENSAESSMSGSSITDDDESSVIDNASDDDSQQASDGGNSSDSSADVGGNDALQETIKNELETAINASNAYDNVTSVLEFLGETWLDGVLYDTGKVRVENKLDGNKQYMVQTYYDKVGDAWIADADERIESCSLLQDDNTYVEYEKNEDGEWEMVDSGAVGADTGANTKAFMFSGDINDLSNAKWEKEDNVYSLTQDVPVTSETNEYVSTTYTKFTIEVKDGLLYQICARYEKKSNNVESEAEGGLGMSMYSWSEIIMTFSDYGTTTVTLPFEDMSGD